MKKKIAVLMAGVLFALTLGIGCGTAAVENIATKKTVPAGTEEASSKGEEWKETPMETDGAGGENPEKEEAGRKPAAQEEAGETEKQKALREELGVPETWRVEKTDEKGMTNVIDATVIVPDADSFVEVSAEVKHFGNEEIEKHVKPILGEGGLYWWEPEGYVGALEDKERAESALRLKEYHTENERRNEEQNLQFAEEQIKAMTERGGEPKQVEVPVQMTSYDKVGMGEYFDYLIGLTDLEQRTMRLDVAEYGLSFDAWPVAGTHSCTISEEMARTLAEDYVRKMGLSEELVLDCVDAPQASYESATFGRLGYIFYYVREIGGVPIAYSLGGMNGGGLKIIVDDQGVLAIDYNDCVIGDDGEPVTLLPFSEIREVYERELAKGCILSEEWLASVSINEVKLTYHWIYDPDDNRKGKLVPSWDAFGTRELVNEDRGTFSYGSDNMERECLMSISAVDGTVLKGL